MRRSREAAEKPLLLLAALAVMFLTALAVVAGRHAIALRQTLACSVSLDSALTQLSALGLLLPAGTAVVVVLAGFLALSHQLWATRRILRRVLATGVEVPPRVVWLSRTAGLADRVDVVADRTAFTFCYGLRSPRVCLSSALVDALPDDELLAVMRHEAHHMRHHDPAKILLSRTLAGGLGFLPVAGKLRDGYLAGKEICADADASQVAGRLPLARALWRLLSTEQPLWPAGVLALGAVTPTEARVQGLLGTEPRRPVLPRPWDWIVTLALIAGILGFSHGAASVARASIHEPECVAHGLVLPEGEAGLRAGVSRGADRVP